MAQVRLLGGKPLLVGGKVALSDTCCCQTSVPCDLPVGLDCPHAICFELKLDSSDTSGHDFLDIQSGSTVLGGAYFDGAWQAYGWVESATATAISPHDTWHAFVFQFYAPGDGSVRCKWFIDGVAQTEFELMDSGESPS